MEPRGRRANSGRTLRRAIRTRIRRGYLAARTERVFHRDWYDSNVWNGGVTWEGIRILKNPLDLWRYQQILWEKRPALLVETGTADGGSALYFARIMDILGTGKVVTVDINRAANLPEHPRIEYISASSTAPQTVDQLQGRAADCESVMVILDSDHSQEHVADELRSLAPLVTPGQYLVVEDTNVNGHPARPSHGAGPMEALQAFLAEADRPFVVDEEMESFKMTFNPSGWLRRISI